MQKKNTTFTLPPTFDNILRIEHRIENRKGDLVGLFQKYVYDLILLRELRARLAEEMVDDAFPPSSDDRTPTFRENFDVKWHAKQIRTNTL